MKSCCCAVGGVIDSDDMHAFFMHTCLGHMLLLCVRRCIPVLATVWRALPVLAAARGADTHRQKVEAVQEHDLYCGA